MKSLQTIALQQGVELVKPICLVGMPGIADIGKFAIDQLIGAFNAEKLYNIIFYGYPAGVIIDNSIISAPKAEVFYWKNEDGERDILFITADAQPMNPREIYELSDYIVKILAGLNVECIVSLGGYPIQKKPSSEPKIYITATDRKYVDKIRAVSECLEISKGVVIGANGLIPSLAKIKKDIDGIVLLAETSQNALMNENATDLNASMKLIKLINEIFDLSLDLDFSSRKVDSMNENLEKRRRELEEELEMPQSLTSKEHEEKALYI